MNVLGKAITHSILFRWEYNNKGWEECVGDGEGGQEAALSQFRALSAFCKRYL